MRDAGVVRMPSASYEPLICVYAMWRSEAKAPILDFCSCSFWNLSVFHWPGDHKQARLASSLTTHLSLPPHG